MKIGGVRGSGGATLDDILAAIVAGNAAYSAISGQLEIISNRLGVAPCNSSIAAVLCVIQENTRPDGATGLLTGILDTLGGARPPDEVIPICAGFDVSSQLVAMPAHMIDEEQNALSNQGTVYASVYHSLIYSISDTLPFYGDNMLSVAVFSAYSDTQICVTVDTTDGQSAAEISRLVHIEGDTYEWSQETLICNLGHVGFASNTAILAAGTRYAVRLYGSGWLDTRVWIAEREVGIS